MERLPCHHQIQFRFIPVGNYFKTAWLKQLLEFFVSWE